jgi:hypothetical protein
MRTVINPALMMVVQLDSVPAAITPSSAPQGEEGDERVEGRDRTSGLQNTTK